MIRSTQHAIAFDPERLDEREAVLASARLLGCACEPEITPMGSGVVSVPDGHSLLVGAARAAAARPAARYDATEETPCSTPRAGDGDPQPSAHFRRVSVSTGSLRLEGLSDDRES
jgi:hypothetical protein